MNSDQRKLIKRLRKAGWTVEFQRRGGHLRAIPPGSKLAVTMPSSPSCSRSMRNTIRDLKKYGWTG